MKNMFAPDYWLKLSTMEEHLHSNAVLEKAHQSHDEHGQRPRIMVVSRYCIFCNWMAVFLTCSRPCRVWHHYSEIRGWWHSFSGTAVFGSAEASYLRAIPPLAEALQHHNYGAAVCYGTLVPQHTVWKSFQGVSSETFEKQGSTEDGNKRRRKYIY